VDISSALYIKTIYTFHPENAYLVTSPWNFYLSYITSYNYLATAILDFRCLFLLHNVGIGSVGMGDPEKPTKSFGIILFYLSYNTCPKSYTLLLLSVLRLPCWISGTTGMSQKYFSQLNYIQAISSKRIASSLPVPMLQLKEWTGR
jgi:hypothetical protein